MLRDKINKIFLFLIKNKYLILITFLALFLRLYNLPNSINFSWDQERDAFVVKQILIEKKPVLIGPRVVDDQGFMLGPYFFYILAPFYLITNLNPFATILFIAFYTLLFTISSFFILKKIFSQKIAHIFIFIWSILPMAITIDTISWNPLLVPFLFIFLLYLLNVLDLKKIKNLIILGFYLGFSFNIHVQLIILTFISFIFLINKKNILKNILYTILGFLISFLPLLIFDLRHNFINLNLFLNFFGSTSSIKNPFAFLPVWTNYVSALTIIKSNFLSILFWFIFALILFIFSKKNKFNKLFFFTWLFFPIIFIFYGKRPSEYYFNFSLPIIILVLSQIIVNLKINSKILSILLFLLIFTSISNRLKENNISSLSLANKIKVVKYIGQVTNNEKFNISYSVPIGQNNGYSYLMDYFKIKPTGDPKDPLIEIIIPGQENYPTFNGISLKIPSSFNK